MSKAKKVKDDFSPYGHPLCPSKPKPPEKFLKVKKELSKDFFYMGEMIDLEKYTGKQIYIECEDDYYDSKNYYIVVFEYIEKENESYAILNKHYKEELLSYKEEKASFRKRKKEWKERKKEYDADQREKNKQRILNKYNKMMKEENDKG